MVSLYSSGCFITVLPFTSCHTHIISFAVQRARVASTCSTAELGGTAGLGNAVIQCTDQATGLDKGIEGFMQECVGRCCTASWLTLQTGVEPECTLRTIEE